MTHTMIKLNDVQQELLIRAYLMTMWNNPTLSIGKPRPTADDVEASLPHTFCLNLLEHPSAYHACNHHNIFKTLSNNNATLEQYSSLKYQHHKSARFYITTRALRDHREGPHRISRITNQSSHHHECHSVYRYLFAFDSIVNSIWLIIYSWL